MEKIYLQDEYNFPAMCNHCRVRCLSSSFLGVPPLGDSGTPSFFAFDEIIRAVAFYTESLLHFFCRLLQTVCQKNYCCNVKKDQKKLSMLSKISQCYDDPFTYLSKVFQCYSKKIDCSTICVQCQCRFGFNEFFYRTMTGVHKLWNKSGIYNSIVQKIIALTYHTIAHKLISCQ